MTGCKTTSVFVEQKPWWREVLWSKLSGNWNGNPRISESHNRSRLFCDESINESRTYFSLVRMIESVVQDLWLAGYRWIRTADTDCFSNSQLGRQLLSNYWFAEVKCYELMLVCLFLSVASSVFLSYFNWIVIQLSPRVLYAVTEIQMFVKPSSVDFSRKFEVARRPH